MLLPDASPLTDDRETLEGTSPATAANGRKCVSVPAPPLLAPADEHRLTPTEPAGIPLAWRRGTVSLLDMLPFFAKSFSKKLIEQFEVKSPSVGSIATYLRDIGQIVGQFGLTTFQERGERVFRDWHAERLTLESALYELRAFREELITELGKHLYFVIPPQDRHFYEASALTPGAVSKFTSASEELSESGKCIALDRHTASVYHSMRGLEFGLKALANRLGLTYDRQTWGQIIKSIEDRIPVYRRANPRDRYLDSYSETATHFLFLKDAWRDHTMHARKDYRPDKAKEILNHSIHVIEDLTSIGLEES